jgi:two-component system, sensor histidine kinase YesM
MFEHWNLKSLSIYPKLVISFLLVIVPIYVVSLMMNQSGKNIVENQLSEALQAKVHFYLS